MKEPPPIQTTDILLASHLIRALQFANNAESVGAIIEQKVELVAPNNNPKSPMALKNQTVITGNSSITFTPKDGKPMKEALTAVLGENVTMDERQKKMFENFDVNVEGNIPIGNTLKEAMGVQGVPKLPNPSLWQSIKTRWNNIRTAANKGSAGKDIDQHKDTQPVKHVDSDEIRVTRYSRNAVGTMKEVPKNEQQIIHSLSTDELTVTHKKPNFWRTHYNKAIAAAKGIGGKDSSGHDGR